MRGFFTKKSHWAVLVLILSTLLISGCTPPGYSADAKKKVYDNNKDAVKEWFADNVPSAKIVSMEAYADVGDLFNAITGEYKYDSERFKFLYDCQSDTMYLSEYNDRIVELLSDEICNIYGFTPDRTAIELDEHIFELISANDQGDERYGHALYGEKDTVNELVFPYGSAPEDLVANMLKDENPVARFNVHAFVEKIPEYNPEEIRKIPGLKFIAYTQPADYEYSGITFSVHYDNSAFSYYSNIKKIKDNLYVGYCFREEMKVNEVGDVGVTSNSHADLLTDFEYEETGKNEFRVTLPSHNCDLLILSKKKKFFNCYTTSSGEYYEDEISRGAYKKDKIHQGYVFSYEANGAFPDTDLVFYRPIRRSKSYTIKMK